jgi:hypothetical protein
VSGKQKGFKNVRCGCKQDGGKASGKQKGFKDVRCACKQGDIAERYVVNKIEVEKWLADGRSMAELKMLER